MRLISLSLLLLASIGYAQDSLIYYHELQFESDLEESYFNELYNGNTENLFEAFYAPYEGDLTLIHNEKHSYQYQVGGIHLIKRPKNQNKYVKKLYDELHERLLRKYEDLVFFDRIFEDGVYNCVTACAIYGLTFEQLGIPYTIKETPTHVYLVAFPGDDQVIIETTDPVNGFQSFSPVFKQQYVSLLEQQKIIDRAELSQGVSAIFNKYYYSSSEVNLVQLAGLQYYNKAVESFNAKKYDLAVTNFEKAFLLYNSDQTRQMLFASLSMVVSGSSYTNDFDVESLGKISRFNMYDITNAEVVGEFGRITQKQLLSNNDTATYSRSYQILMERIPEDSMLQRDISFLYYYERARILYNRAMFDEALPFALKAYESKPESIDSESLLLSCYTDSYRDDEAAQALVRLEKFMVDFPALKRNNRFGAIWSNLYLVNMYDNYLSKNYQKAFEFKKSFEELISQYSNYPYDRRIAGSAYSQVVAYYFRRGQKQSARNALDQGFKYAPGNGELKTRQYMLNR